MTAKVEHGDLLAAVKYFLGCIENSAHIDNLRGGVMGGGFDRLHAAIAVAEATRATSDLHAATVDGTEFRKLVGNVRGALHASLPRRIGSLIAFIDRWHATGIAASHIPLSTNTLECCGNMSSNGAMTVCCGEPVSTQEDESNTATVEDGYVAKMALDAIAGAHRIYPIPQQDKQSALLESAIELISAFESLSKGCRNKSWAEWQNGDGEDVGKRIEKARSAYRKARRGKS